MKIKAKLSGGGRVIGESGEETVRHGGRTEPAQGTTYTCMTLVYVSLCNHI